MTAKRIESYTAAGIFPAKVIQNKDVLDARGRIVPYHIQVNPTNACNLKCSFCSCANRTRGERIPALEIVPMLTMFARLGTKAMTVTGGGEPLLYPTVNEMITTAKALGISSGLVTNGTVIDRLKAVPLTWVRVSFSDDRALDDQFKAAVRDAVERVPKATWSFSYVLTREPDWMKLRELVAFAAGVGFEYVRLVSDLLDLSNVPDMEEAVRCLRGQEGEDRVIYQGRKDWTVGRERCLISLLKPVIGADGGIWPCCGSQYALDNPGLDYEKTMRMGHWKDFEEMMKEQRHFCGDVCRKCYYDPYNEALDLLTMNLEHKEFV